MPRIVSLIALSSLVGALLPTPAAVAGRWVPDGTESQSTTVPDGPVSIDPGGPAGPGSASQPTGSSDDVGSDCDPDQDLPNFTKKNLAQETVLSTTTESTTPSTKDERRNKPLQVQTVALPDQMLSFSYVKKVEGHFLNQYALQVWGKSTRTTTIQPFEIWEVSKWQSRQQKLVERTYQVTEWDQMVVCPSGAIDSQLVDINVTSEQSNEFTPWAPQTGETLLSSGEDPPVVVDKLTSTYSVAVLVHKQSLAKLGGPAAGSKARAGISVSGDLSRRGQEAMSASTGRASGVLGAGQVNASMATTNAYSYTGGQAVSFLASSVKDLTLQAPGFQGPLVLAGGKVQHNGATYKVQAVTVQEGIVKSVSFYGPDGKVVKATVAP
ncbi:MAG: hypothetical protein VKP57_09450 [Candidatus Sericytochromatia bacterium]|nr:hypothetical protein [Candidatus Sericytochromatia bacterium]